MISKAIDIVRSIVEGLQCRILFYNGSVSVVSGTVRITVKKTLWIRAGSVVNVNGTEYTISAFLRDNYIDIVTEDEITAGYIELSPPSFFHGTVTQVNNDITAIQVKNCSPLVYMVEVMTSELQLAKDAALQQSPEIRLFFLDETKQDDWGTTLAYTNAVRPMEALADQVIHAFQRSKYIGLLTSARVWNQAKAGAYTDKGTTANAFAATFAGMELRMNLPLRNTGCDSISVQSITVEIPPITYQDPAAWHRGEDTGEYGFIGDHWELTEDGHLLPVENEAVNIGSATRKINELHVRELNYDVLIPVLPLETVLGHGNTTGGNDIILSAGDAITSPDGTHAIEVTDDALELTGLQKIAFNATVYEFAGLTDAILKVNANGELGEVTVTAANGLSYTSGTLAMAAAGAAQAGAVNLLDQAMGAGKKTFADNVFIKAGAGNIVNDFALVTRDIAARVLIESEDTVGRFQILNSSTGYSSAVGAAFGLSGVHGFLTNNTSLGGWQFYSGGGNIAGGISGASSPLWGFGFDPTASAPGALVHIRGRANLPAFLVETDDGADYILCEEVSGVRRVGFFGVTPVARQVVPTGSSTDTVIMALQNLGFFSQT